MATIMSGGGGGGGGGGGSWVKIVSCYSWIHLSLYKNKEKWSSFVLSSTLCIYVNVMCRLRYCIANCHTYIAWKAMSDDV